jgi:IstB-like ATP binding protein
MIIDVSLTLLNLSTTLRASRRREMPAAVTTTRSGKCRMSVWTAQLPHTAAEDLLEVIMRRYERASTLLTSNRPVDDWGKLLGDTAAITALLDRLLHHAHVLKCGPRSWRTKVQPDLRTEDGPK